MRVIKYTVTADGHVSPATKQWAGVQGEHNATRIDFDYSALANKTGHAMWRIDFDSAEAGFDPNNTVYPASAEDIISREIPQKFTKFGGDMTAKLVGTETAPDGSGVASKIVCSIPVSLYFTESETHEQTEGEVAESLSQMERHVLDVAEKAEKNISEAEQKALTTVAGIQEQLDNGDFVGPVGPQGPSGPQGDDYVLTEADKDEIAEKSAEKIDVSGKQEKFAEVIENADGQTLEVLKKLLIMYESNEDFRVNAYLTLDSMFAQLKANTVDLYAFSDLTLTANDLKFIAYNGIDFNDYRLQNIAAPKSDSDAANKKYVDDAIPTIDQTYTPESENAQSGKAVAEAVSGKADVENWELIQDVTLTEEVTNLTNLEVNSKKLYCEMLAQKPTDFSGSNTIHFQPVQRAGSYRGISCTSQYSSGGFIAFQGAMEIAPSGRINASGQIKDGEYGYNQNQMVSVLTQNYADDGLIKSVQFKTSGLGIGTTIKIWGVRA